MVSHDSRFVFKFVIYIISHLLLLQENIYKGLKVVHDQVRCHSWVMLIPLRSKFSCPHLLIIAILIYNNHANNWFAICK